VEHKKIPAIAEINKAGHIYESSFNKEIESFAG